MLLAALCILVVVPGALAAFIEHTSSPLRLAERHHSHHDTYVVPPDFTRSLVVAMLAVGGLGVLLSVFCAIGVFDSSARVPLAFAGGFAWTLFALWAMLERYKVSFYEDHAVIAPFFGHDFYFFYNDVQSLDWKGLRRASGYRDLRVVEKGGRTFTIYAVVDMEQVLLHLDRFDVLAPLAQGWAGPEGLFDLREGLIPAREMLASRPMRPRGARLSSRETIDSEEGGSNFD